MKFLFNKFRQPIQYIARATAAFDCIPAKNPNLNFCIHGKDSVDAHLHHLRSKITNEPEILNRYTNQIADLSGCQIDFISTSVIHNLSATLNQMNEKPILTVSDSLNASLQGVAINMSVKESKVAFKANSASAKVNGLKLNSQLIRFASEVYQ